MNRLEPILKFISKKINPSKDEVLYPDITNNSVVLSKEEFTLLQTFLNALEDCIVIDPERTSDDE